MIEVENGRAHELRVDGRAWRIAAQDARDLVFYNNVLHLFAHLGSAIKPDSVEIDDAAGTHELPLPADIDVRPVDGPEPAAQWTFWLGEAASQILTADEYRADERYAREIMDPDRVCLECGRMEMSIRVVDDWLGLSWSCPECHFVKPAWPPGGSM